MAVCVVVLRVRQLLFIFIGLFSTYSPILNGVVAFYPASGYRFHASGAFAATGSHGSAWGSVVPGAYGNYLFFFSTTVNPMDSFARARGFSVRCVQNLCYVCFGLCVL